jgi:hypothetical protein
MLCEAGEQINPAIVLAEELMRKDLRGTMDFADIERAENTLIAARTEIERVERQLNQIIKTQPQPGRLIPPGF